jgi:hypothetical protein
MMCLADLDWLPRQWRRLPSEGSQNRDERKLKEKTLMRFDERRLLVRNLLEQAVRLVRESWEVITALELVVPSTGSVASLASLC